MITIIFGRVAQFLLALVMMRVATTLLSPEEMGRVSLVLTTIAFFAMFLINPVGMFINRRLHAWQAGGMAQYYFIRYVFYLLLSAFVAAFLLRLLYISGSINFGVSFSWLTFLLCGSLVFNTINQTAIPSLNLLGDSRHFMLLSVCTVAMSLSCATLLVIVLEPVAQYWVSGILLGQAILALVGARALFTKLRRVRAQVSASIQKRHLLVLFHFAWPVSIAAGLGWIQGQGYRYLIEGSLGFAELGLFVAGYGISAGMIAGFESVLTTYFQPRLYRGVSKSDPVRQAEAWQRYAATVIPSLILTVALVVVLAPELTRVLLGENFQSAVDYVLWGALAEAARVLMGVYSLIAYVFMRTRWLILPNLVGAFLAITLTALFIPGFGTAGVGMGLVLSGFTIVILMHIFLVKRVGGGPRVRPVLIAGGGGLALWTMTFGFRHLLHIPGWQGALGILVIAGTTYSGLQYLFLRKHLTNRVGE